tara:strand:+ start:402 stop:1043 length:642 start_codon:yes stop_codon:yes gene_type:complete
MDAEKMTQRFMEHQVTCAGFPSCTIDHPEWEEEVFTDENESTIKPSEISRHAAARSKYYNAATQSYTHGVEGDYVKGFILRDGTVLKLQPFTPHHKSIDHIRAVRDYYQKNLSDKVETAWVGRQQAFMKGTGAIRYGVSIHGVDGDHNTDMIIEATCCPSGHQIKSISQMVQSMQTIAPVHFYMDIDNQTVHDINDMKTLKEARSFSRLMSRG